VCHGTAAAAAAAAAAAGTGESAAGKERMNDVHSLVLLPGGQRLCWSDCDSPDLAREDTLQGEQHLDSQVQEEREAGLCGWQEDWEQLERSRVLPVHCGGWSAAAQPM
jgi:hypothetical protein